MTGIEIKTLGGTRFRVASDAETARLYVEDRDGDILAYLGLAQQDALRALAKAILNAVEPEALVENQKDAEPEPLKPGDWVKVADNSPYNDNFRGQTLQVANPARSLFGNLRVVGTDGYPGIVGSNWVTFASAPTTEQQYDVPALVAAVASLEDRVADLEAVAKDDEIKVGDRVRYTDKGILPGEVREVTDIYSTGATTRYRLVHVDGYMRGEQAHSGASRDQIEKVN